MALNTEPLWWGAAAPQEICADPFPEETEVAIVGSGYVGLSAALELSRAGSKVVVEERVEQMFRDFRGMSNTQRMLFYYRASPDHRRVVFSGRASFAR